ncbi:YegP family protein [Pararcticibacter amylolyticus]|uniref:DUF1508 domain-containing protein n=1 Tax=Pararcticibacter amylolyticus TaxID=2173175 RepID=A0A2U2P9H6_9SPHI|nr:YegP family protein [Pararcticibacter amylolyticus]PWG78020.1 hypothetical protein DDR33_24460 [Pararcticibacter amylolyticus]
MNNPKFQVFRSTANNQYYYHLKSGEGYKTRQSCYDGIASVKANAPLDSLYDRKDSNYNYTFNLKATNHEIIGRSENYTSYSI